MLLRAFAGELELKSKTKARQLPCCAAGRVYCWCSAPAGTSFQLPHKEVEGFSIYMSRTNIYIKLYQPCSGAEFLTSSARSTERVHRDNKIELDPKNVH
jgi:hypothetical protein